MEYAANWIRDLWAFHHQFPGFDDARVQFIHPASPTRGDQADSAHTWRRRLSPSHQGGRVWSTVLDGIRGPVTEHSLASRREACEWMKVWVSVCVGVYGTTELAIQQSCASLVETPEVSKCKLKATGREVRLQTTCCVSQLAGAGSARRRCSSSSSRESSSIAVATALCIWSEKDLCGFAASCAELPHGAPVLGERQDAQPIVDTA